MTRRVPFSPPPRVLALALVVSVTVALIGGVASTIDDTTFPTGLALNPAGSPSSEATVARPTLPAVAWIQPSDEPGLIGSFALTAPAPPTAATASARSVKLPTTRVATRVAVPGLSIDLPVIVQPTAYPPCKVAMYLQALRQPGQGGATYLYAHAQAGSFLPLLNGSLVNDGAAMIGLTVQIWTGDNFLFTYRITEVRRHVTDLAGAYAWPGESAWLQTSEGRGAATPKLQVVATPVSTASADYASAHPVPHPISC